MTAASAPPAPGSLPVTHRAGASLLGSGRLVRLELRHNAMLWLLPLVGALFWFNRYREHPPTLATPWIWPAHPPYDVGGALCAAVVFAAGMVVIMVRGARESAGD